MFKQYNPQIILMDINMPVMDGYEATKEIRKYSAKVPIIAITAFAYASDEQRVMESGFDGYMPKPINARLLKAQLTEIIQKRIILLKRQRTKSKNEYLHIPFMTEEKYIKPHRKLVALSPLLVFLCLYLVTSILVNDFYKVPITVAFLVSSCYAIAITKGLKLDQRIYQFSVGAANKNILLMIWIFILAGAFAHSAKQMGAIDATVNLTLHILPDNLLLAGIFIAACFISLSIGTSVGTIVALTPVAVGLAEKTEIALPFMVAVVVGGSFSETTYLLSPTPHRFDKTQECVMRDKFRVIL